MNGSNLSLVCLAIALLSPTAARSDEGTFVWSLESRAASTNRSKIGNHEYVQSCGSGPYLEIYRTYTSEYYNHKEGSDTAGSWSRTETSIISSTTELDGTYSQSNFHRVDANWYGDSCFYESLWYFLHSNEWIGGYSGNPYCGTGTGWFNFTNCTTSSGTSPTVRYSNGRCVDSGYSGFSTNSTIETLTDPYTTPMLLGGLPDFPSEWSSGTAGGNASIYDKISYPQVRDFSASSQKAQVRFKVKANPGERFEIHYRRFKQYENGEGTNWMDSVKGVGTGGWSHYPDQPIEFLPSYKIVTTDGCEDYVGCAEWIEPTCGFSEGKSGCTTSCSRDPGGWGAGMGSVSVTASFGTDSYGEHSGRLTLYGIEPTNTLTTPKELVVSGSLKNLEIIRSGGDLRQVKALQCFADIVATSATSFEVRFYLDAGGFNSDSGLYEPSGVPFSLGIIEQIGSSNHIRLTTSNGVVRVYDYEWSTVDNGWTLTSGGGARKESSFWHEGTLTRTNFIRNAADAIVFQERKQFLELTNYGRVVSKHIIGTGSAAQTNLWFYYDNETTDGTNYGSVKMTIDPRGFWKRYQYDHQNRLTNEVSQFLNAVTNAAENLCRVVRYDYASLDGTNDFLTRIELLQNIEIAREYTVKYPSVAHYIRCVTPSASWTNANNLVIKSSDTYATLDVAGKPHRIISPDGTMQLYEYNSPGVTTVYSGQPNGNFSAVTNGTKTVTTASASGGILSRYTYDIALGGYYSLDWETTSHDNLGRPTTTSHSGIATTTLNYDCCGVESSVDRDGVTTTYIHDVLHRQVGAMRNDIITTNLLDAAGNVLSAVRVGKDGTTNLLRRANYDTAGRMLNETNALGGVTSYAHSFDGSGQTVVTTTFPDNGQRVETRYQDGSVKSVTGSAAFPVFYDYGAYSNGSSTKETKGSASGSEWVKSYTDMLGRSWKTEYADGAASTNFYNAIGQLQKAVDPDGVTRLYTYNGLGQTDKTILDMDRNGVGTDAVDRIVRSTNNVVNYSGYAARHSQVYQTADNGSEILVSERFVIPAINTSISLSFALGTTNVTTHGSGQRTVTTTFPDSSQTVSLYTNGLLASVTRLDSINNPLSTINYSHDSHGRQYQAIDARNGATTYTYNAADQVLTATSPSPDGVVAGLVTTNYFDVSGRNWKTTLLDGTSVTNEFYTTGQLKKNTGSRVYPAQYTQDDQGRSKTLTTWQNFAGSSGSAVTTWNYDSQRGLLSSKRYADNTGPNYTNTAAGRLKNRLWARNLNTTYAYNNAGDLNNVSYTDGTSSVATGFDRRGKATSITNGSVICSMVHNDAGQMLSESCSGGPLNGLSVTNGYDEFLRRTNLTLNTPLSTINSAFGYDSASRLSFVTSDMNSAGYSYLADSALVGEIYYTNNGTLCMTRSNQFDNLNRLTNLVWNVGGSNVASFAYQYNSANQRTRVTLVDGSYWLYQYDALGQVTSAKRYWSDGTPVAGQQSTFTFDEIGNRKVTASGGDNGGANLRSAYYTNNTLNQITGRTVPGLVNILGSATNTATVSLWSPQSTNFYAPTSRKGDYFRGEMPLNNSTGAVWLTVTNVAAISNYTGADIVTNTIGKLFVPKTPEIFGYDADGNLTNDGRWSYTWDAENRATSFARNSNVPSGSMVKFDCQYDHRSRRTQKVVSSWNGSAYVAQSTNKFVYDGWNLIAILDATNGLVQSFTWGTDASGTMQGAGGVGGLISMTVHQGTNAGTYFYCFDGNHNVATLVNATNGAIEAVYELDAFLRILRATGRLAFVNPFVGSTKFCDWETGFLYYGYRYYDPDTGRWLSRDPIEEEGGINLMEFANNNGINWWDYLGTDVISTPRQTPIKFYCDAAKKHPENKWLDCACEVSGEINALIDALVVTYPFVENPKKNKEIIQWFRCTRSCILKKFKEFYKVYDGGAGTSDVNLTPHWEAACKKCIGKPEAISAKDCCSAMVAAEQSGVEDCKGQCGEFPGDPTKMPIPGFEGDFSKLEDRIKYGLQRCCEDSKGNNSPGKDEKHGTK